MPKVKQLTVAVKNQPGSLAHVASVLGDAKVNIIAFLTGVEDGEGFVQVLVNDVNKAKRALRREGLSFAEETVLHVQVRNKPGALAEYSEKLAAKNINITSGYATTSTGSDKASLVFVVSDLAKAIRLR